MHMADVRGMVRRSASCNVAFSFGDKYACGLGTCQVVNLAVSQLAPEDIDIPWMLLLTHNSWASDTYIHTVSRSSGACQAATGHSMRRARSAAQFLLVWLARTAVASQSACQQSAYWQSA